MTPNKHLAALQAHWKRHKAFPPMAKLTEVLRLASTGGVFKVLGRLTEAGYLERVDGRIAPTKKFFERAVLGTVRAGLPQPADMHEGIEMMNLEDYLIDHPERSSFCRVKGDSMRDAGLAEGDFVVMEANTLPKAGDIVVAVVDSQLTVKYLRADGAGQWFLEPANAAYEAIRPTTDLEVLGVVVSSFRRIRR